MNLFIEFYDKGFKLFNFPIAWYGVIIACGMLIAVLIAMALTKYRGFKSDDILIIALYVLPLAVIGARLYYMAFATYPMNFFDFKDGGLAIYGGVIGGALGVGLYCIIHKKKFFALADIAAPVLILAQGIGRWGNFINQEAYGYATNVGFFPFSVNIDYCTQFSKGLCDCNGSGWHLATFFYEFVWNIGVFALLLLLIVKIKPLTKGVIVCLYFVGYGIGRFWIEGLRTDSLMMGSLRVSQFLSVLLVAGGLLVMLFLLWKDGKFKNVKWLQWLPNPPKWERKSKGEKTELIHTCAYAGVMIAIILFFVVGIIAGWLWGLFPLILGLSAFIFLYVWGNKFAETPVETEKPAEEVAHEERVEMKKETDLKEKQNLKNEGPEKK